MDLDTRFMSCSLGIPSGKEIKLMSVEEITHAVINKCVKTGIQENNAQYVTRGRVAHINLSCIIKQTHQQSIPLLFLHKKA